MENPRILHEVNGETYSSEPVDLKEGITTREVLIFSKVREVNKINFADFRAAADCFRTLGFDQDKYQIRKSRGRRY